MRAATGAESVIETRVMLSVEPYHPLFELFCIENGGLLTESLTLVKFRLIQHRL